MRSRRYSGRWSAYLLTIRWANSPGPGSPLVMGIAGLAALMTTAAGSAGVAAGGASVAAAATAAGSGWSRGTAGVSSGVAAGATRWRRRLQQGHTYLWT